MFIQNIVKIVLRQSLNIEYFRKKVKEDIHKSIITRTKYGKQFFLFKQYVEIHLINLPLNAKMAMPDLQRYP